MPLQSCAKSMADARHHGLTQFSVYQGHWSCAFRDFEREILPMCESEGLALAPWGALGRGQLVSSTPCSDMLLFCLLSYVARLTPKQKLPEEFNHPDRDGRKGGPQPEKSIRIALKLDELAKKKGTVITSIALAYVRHKAPYVFPIVGGRKVSHLKDNIEGLGIELTDEEISEIEGVEPFDPGFPYSMLFPQPYSSNKSTSDIFLVTSNTPLEAQPKLKVSLICLWELRRAT